MEKPNKKEIENSDCRYKNPIDLISLCQTSIKDGIEELLIGTIEDKHNFSIIIHHHAIARTISISIRSY